jgi:general secretion pathway protein A
MLSNLETEKSKLMQIVMVGQPNLRDKLAAPELEQLRQRITVSYHLEPLDAEETAHYINHRLRRAAINTALEFPRDVTSVVHARSRGVPRIINVICDAALVFGYAEERRQIDLALTEDVLGELEATGVLLRPTTQRAPAPAAPADIQVAAPVTTKPAAPAAPPVTLAAAGMVPDTLTQHFVLRSAQLDEREQLLRQREHELAEQRRILAEEYRLLRARHANVPAPGTAVRTPSSRPPERFDTDATQGFWNRVKRVMLGISAPTVEGS